MEEKETYLGRYQSAGEAMESYFQLSQTGCQQSELLKYRVVISLAILKFFLEPEHVQFFENNVSFTLHHNYKYNYFPLHFS
jgi:hypothetical protein